MEDVIMNDIRVLFGHGKRLLSSLSSVPLARPPAGKAFSTLSRKAPVASDANTFRIGLAHAVINAQATHDRHRSDLI
jgi:hypothetical protein